MANEPTSAQIKAAASARKHARSVKLAAALAAQEAAELAAFEQALREHDEVRTGQVRYAPEAPREPSEEAANYSEIPKGWKLVPVEPTEAMLEEFHDRIRIEARPADQLCSVLNDRYVWAAMLSAAPPAPAGDGWRPIITHNPKTDPAICLVAYEDGHVTAAEYSELLEGGPDDHRQWETHIAPRAENGTAGLYAWPIAWRPLPAPPSDGGNK
jgi:hypothetical protein